MPSTPRSTRREALEPTAQRRVVGDAGGVPRLVEEALVQPAADFPASAFARPSDRTKASKSSRQQAPSGRKPTHAREGGSNPPPDQLRKPSDRRLFRSPSFLPRQLNLPSTAPRPRRVCKWLIRLSFSAACECAGFKWAWQCRTDSDLRLRSSQRLLTETGSNWSRTVNVRKPVALRISL